MSTVPSLFRVTKELHSLLAEETPKEQRDQLVEKISELLDYRDKLISQVKPPYTEEEQKLGTAIVQLNVDIDEKLNSLKREIQLDITQLKKSKQSTTKYTNPYQSGPTDGMFFDKRK
ncbi:flagellar protein FliT [Fredinandcohnia humi]